MASGSVARFKESEIAYFLNRICPETDYAFRFAWLITGSNSSAFSAVKAAITTVIAKLAEYNRTGRDDMRSKLLQILWTNLGKNAQFKPVGAFAQYAGKWDLATTGMWVASEYCGMSVGELEKIFGQSRDNVTRALSTTNEHLLGSKPSGPDGEYFAKNLWQYLDSDCPSDVRARIEKLLEEEAFADALQSHQQRSGAMQMELQSHYLNDDEMQAIYDLVEGADVRRTQEAVRIEQAEKSEFKSNLKRRLALTALVAAGVFWVVFHFSSPPKVSSFDPIRHLGLESIAMIEDPSGRLDFMTKEPTAEEAAAIADSDYGKDADMTAANSDSRADVQQYFDNHPELKKLKIQVLKNTGTGKAWEPSGAAAYNYDGIYVGVTRYDSRQVTGDSLFHYVFAGELSSLPESKGGDAKAGSQTLRYQSYGSDNLNVIAWKQGDGTIGMLFGTRPISEMAQFVVEGL